MHFFPILLQGEGKVGSTTRNLQKKKNKMKTKELPFFNPLHNDENGSKNYTVGNPV